MHAGNSMGLVSQGVGCMEVRLRKTSCRCTGTRLRCAPGRQQQPKCQSGLSFSAVGFPRKDKEKSTELAVEYPDSGSC